MIKGIIFTEGNNAISPPDQGRAFAGIADGQNILQNAFSELFQQGIPNLKAVFIFDMRGGWRNTLYDFARAIATSQEISISMLIDYADIPGKNSLTKKVSLGQTLGEKDGLPAIPGEFSQYFDQIFFMVPKMEAWILSQPEVIEQCFGHLLPSNKLQKFKAKKLAALSITASSIISPDAVLNQLLQYFEKPDRQGKPRTLKYEKGGKVRLAYQILTKLDLISLMAEFEDVNRLVEKLKSL